MSSAIAMRPACSKPPRKLRTVLAAVVLGAAATAALGQISPREAARSEVCRDRPPVADLSVDSRVIVIGEMHGTHEFPRLAQRVLCQIASPTRPTILGLEIDAKSLLAMQDFLNPRSGRHGDQRSLMKEGEQWRLPGDGRGSVAMQALISSAMELQRAGYKVYIDAFSMGSADLPFPLTAEEEVPDVQTEAFMANRIQYRLDAYPDARYVALVGGLHAYKTEGRARRPDFKSMVVRLQKGTAVQVVSGAWLKGSAYLCKMAAGALSCRDHALSTGDQSVPDDKSDIRVDLGELTASSPFVSTLAEPAAIGQTR